MWVFTVPVNTFETKLYIQVGASGFNLFMRCSTSHADRYVTQLEMQRIEEL